MVAARVNMLRARKKGRVAMRRYGDLAAVPVPCFIGGGCGRDRGAVFPRMTRTACLSPPFTCGLICVRS